MRYSIKTATLLLLIICIGSLFTGRYSLSVHQFSELFRTGDVSPEVVTARTVFLLVRIPRILMGIMIGASLSVSGCVLQGVFRNPLASPSILGISAGAGFGASLAIVMFGSQPILLQVCAFLGGMSAVVCASAIALRQQEGHETTLILAGIAVSSLFTALMSLMKTLADPDQQLPAIVFWLMGGLHQSTWSGIATIGSLVLIPLLIIHLSRWKLNVLTMGDTEATSLGLHPRNARYFFIGLATLSVASGVSAVGTIGWVGLIVPHITRLVTGADHKRLIPLSALNGASVLVLLDSFARTITSAEIPIGVLTAFLGAPFFLYLLITQKRRLVQ